MAQSSEQKRKTNKSLTDTDTRITDFTAVTKTLCSSKQFQVKYL